MSRELKLLNREIVGGSIAVIKIEKPDGFKFLPGQFCALTVPDKGHNDDKGLKRTLSIASSPSEKELIFATRLSDSAFKKTLKDLSVGTVIAVDGPFGMFTMTENESHPLVLLAGGLGITPFRSMTKSAAEFPALKLTLFYSSRIPEEAVFLSELQALADSKKNINVIMTITRPEQSSVKWTGLTGRLNVDMIRNGCKYWNEAVYYMAGPPAMVETSGQLLDEMEIPHDRIRTEKWG